MINSKRSNLLDIVKGIMILFIIITHFGFKYPTDYRRYGFFYWIDMAVPVFMIITEYFAAIQLKKSSINSLEEAWKIEIVLPKMLRFLVPFSMAIFVEIPFLYMYGDSLLNIVREIIRGAGHGSYYTPIMLQLIFLRPVIYLVIKKYDWFGTIMCFLVTALWELIQYCWGNMANITQLYPTTPHFYE